MSLKLSKRSDIDGFRVMETLRLVNERIQSGEDIIRMEAGQPCFGAPQPVLEYAKQIITNDPLQGYTESLGMTPLRQRIALYYRDHYGIDMDYNRIAVTTGSSCGFILAFLSAFEAGDTVALCTPTYPAYRNILKSLGINVIEIETSQTTNYQPTVELLEQHGQKFDGLIINSPSNPTGTMLDEDEMKSICAWCDDNGVRIVSDEAYHRITYEKEAQSVLKYSPNAVVLNTFSKYFAMTGWRMGWLIVPEEMAGRVKKLAENLYVSPPTISQHVACKVFDHMEELDGYVNLYKENRDILLAGLPKSGIAPCAAQGAFYLYSDVQNLTNNSEEFCKRMIDEAKVAAISGIDFDCARGHTTIRMSYAGTSDNMHEAVNRLKEWLA